MKLANQLRKAIDEYNGKSSGHNAEAGDTSFENGHWHKTMVDKDGNGQTIHVMPQNDDEEGKKFDKDHVHKIVNWEVQSANGHTHEVIS